MYIGKLLYYLYEINRLKKINSYICEINDRKKNISEMCLNMDIF